MSKAITPMKQLYIKKKHSILTSESHRVSKSVLLFSGSRENGGIYAFKVYVISGLVVLCVQALAIECCRKRATLMQSPGPCHTLVSHVEGTGNEKCL